MRFGSVNIISIFFVCLCWTSSISAQHAGYMGKRFSLGYQLSIGPSVRFLGEEPMHGTNKGQPAVAFLHSVGGSYILSNVVEIQALYGFSKLSGNSEDIVPLIYRLPGGTQYTLSAHGPSVNVRFYNILRGSGPAPLGMYFFVGGGRESVRFEDPQGFQAYINQAVLRAPDAGAYYHTFFQTGAGAGRMLGQRIKLDINTAIRLNFYSNKENPNYTNEAVGALLRTYELFLLNIGVAYSL